MNTGKYPVECERVRDVGVDLNIVLVEGTEDDEFVVFTGGVNGELLIECGALLAV